MERLPFADRQYEVAAPRELEVPDSWFQQNIALPRGIPASQARPGVRPTSLKSLPLWSIPGWLTVQRGARQLAPSEFLPSPLLAAEPPCGDQAAANAKHEVLSFNP